MSKCVFSSAEPGLSMCLYMRMITLSVTACPVITGDPSFCHTLCSLSHPLFHTHPPSTTTAGSSEQPLHQTPQCLHVFAFVCLCGVFLQVCQHPNSRMREWGAEALTALIKAGLAYKHDPPLAQNQVRRANSWAWAGFLLHEQCLLIWQKFSM